LNTTEWDNRKSKPKTDVLVRKRLEGTATEHKISCSSAKTVAHPDCLSLLFKSRQCVKATFNKLAIKAPYELGAGSVKRVNLRI
jgi:hypothetical protein